MEPTPQRNEPAPSEPAARTGKNYLGWAAFIVTIGVIFQQFYTHGYQIISYYIPGFFNGHYLSIFTDNPQFGPLFKTVTALWTFNDFFITALLAVTLVFLIMRKKITTTLLLVFVSFSGLFTLIVGILLQNLLPSDLSGMTLGYNIESAAYLAADVLLFFFYLKSRKFKELFKK